MAVNIPSSAIRQPSDQLSKDTSGITGFAAAWKGPYEDLEAAAAGIVQGDLFEGKTVSTFNLVTIPGGWGLLTINFGESSESGSGSGGGGLEPIKEKWSVRSCRNDVSVLAYCGKDTDNPSRAWIESWQRETNAKVADSGDITLPDGTIGYLRDIKQHDGTLKLIEKIKAGVESVMRFYPVVTRKRVYSAPPGDLQEKLGFIETPPAPGLKSKKPQGLAAFINKFQWLKCQDDCDEGAGNTWSRTESWMGILKTQDNQTPWDPDLYGPNRWSMPYVYSGT